MDDAEMAALEAAAMDGAGKIDTSAEAVERAADTLSTGVDFVLNTPIPEQGKIIKSAAALLRALAAERDSLDGDSLTQQDRIEELKAERDAALARAEEKDGPLWKAISDAAAEIRRLEFEVGVARAERDAALAELEAMNRNMNLAIMETDAARGRAEIAETLWGTAKPGFLALVAERDAALARAARMREALERLGDAAQYAPIDLSRELANARAALADPGA